MRLLAVCLVVCLGCKGQQKVPAPSQAGSGAISEVEARTFAEKLAATATPCTETTLEPLLARPELAHGLCAWLEGSASYRLMRVKPVDGEQRPIMRRLREDEGTLRVAYDQLKLAREDAGLVLVDVYAYRQAKWLSETLPGNTSHPDVAKARELIAAGKQDEAMALVDKLPVAERRELLLRAFQSANLPPDQSKQALDGLAKDFPDDPSIALTLVDRAFALESYDTALHWLAVMAKEVGPDAYLDMTRAIVYLKKGALPEALAAADAEVARLDAERARQVGFAAELQGRIDGALAEAAALADLDAELSAQIVAEQQALLARLPPVPPPATPVAAPVDPDPVAPVAPAPVPTTAPPADGGTEEPATTTTTRPPATTTTTRPPSTTTPRPRTPTPPLATVRGFTVHAEIADEVEAMLDAAAADGFTFGGSAYRSTERQIELRIANCGPTEYDIWYRPAASCSPPTAVPGRSLHEQGRALDLTYEGRLITSRANLGFQWLADNAASYGLFNLPSEPWHWSTTGG